MFLLNVLIKPLGAVASKLNGRQFGRVDGYGNIHGYYFPSAGNIVAYGVMNMTDGHPWTEEGTYVLNTENGYVATTIGGTTYLDDCFALMGGVLDINGTLYYEVL